MRRRIYWLLPDLASARKTMDDLLLARIAEQHMHFVARDDADMTGLHAANVLQTSDVIRAAQAGLVIGGAVGAALGVVAALLFPHRRPRAAMGLCGGSGHPGRGVRRLVLEHDRRVDAEQPAQALPGRHRAGA